MKQTMRKEIKKRKQKLSEWEVLNHSKDIVAKLFPLIAKYEKIGIYLPMKDEVDVTSLLSLERSFFAPVVISDHDMEFYELTSLATVERGKFNLLEPIKETMILPEALEVIIVPLLAFDEKLHRLGQGKGYFDRYLKRSKALKIGVAFEIQKVVEIPCESFDIAMDFIVSEAKVYHK